MATKKVAGKRAAAKRTPASPGEVQAQGGMNADGGPPAEQKQAKERPIRCIQRHADVEFRRAFPKLCQKLIDKAAEDASVQHTQVLLRIIGDVGKPKARQKRSGPSLSEMLFAELKRRQDEREAAMDSAVNPESAAATETLAEGATSEHAEKQ